ncbi:MAG TPA: CRISPR-associated endonuclease Cas2 [Fibrobacteraceae bacterium]|nr:CRISPR-associated endonuclease Cas2 [Fibrobacteraceae bacterium]
MKALSGYRIVWAMLFFDLPVVTKSDKDAYVEFRNYLLDEGFEMAQYSVYLRSCASKEVAEALIKRVEKALPPEGKVYILCITDKQFESTVRFIRTKRQPKQKNPDQLALF